jgi:hypothetical protein
MFSSQLKSFIEKNQAVHGTGYPLENCACLGQIKKLFDMFVCEKCRLTIDDENHILITVPYLNNVS